MWGSFIYFRIFYANLKIYYTIMNWVVATINIRESQKRRKVNIHAIKMDIRVFLLINSRKKENAACIVKAYDFQHDRTIT